MPTTAKNLSDVPAINRFLSYCRMRTIPSKTVMIHAGDLPDILYYIVDGSVDLEQDARRAELRRRIWESIGQLSEIQREILILRDYQDLSYAEIAAAMNRTEGAARNLVYRGIARLSSLLPEDQEG